MELKETLKKPYTEQQKLDFIVVQSHRMGREIRETETALEAWGYTVEEIEKQERERLDGLYLTRSDVERAIYKVKGIDFIDLLKMVETEHPEVDLKALKIELGANNFYRGNPYVAQVGALLGFTSEQLDKFFETNNYLYLTTCTIVINPTPVEAKVKINDVVGNTATLPYETPVKYTVSMTGYKTKTETLMLTENTEINVVLEAKEVK